jgi:hypothetical protein
VDSEILGRSPVVVFCRVVLYCAVGGGMRDTAYHSVAA